MRVLDEPLTGDYVIKRREHRRGPRVTEEWIVYVWPKSEAVADGPYQTYAHAFLQTRVLADRRSTSVWRDHGPSGKQGALQLVHAGPLATGLTPLL